VYEPGGHVLFKSVLLNNITESECRLSGSGENLGYWNPTEQRVGFQCGVCLRAGVTTVYPGTATSLTDAGATHYFDFHRQGLSKVC
jgi:hypothetical protein